MTGLRLGSVFRPEFFFRFPVGDGVVEVEALNGVALQFLKDLQMLVILHTFRQYRQVQLVPDFDHCAQDRAALVGIDAVYQSLSSFTPLTGYSWRS